MSNFHKKEYNEAYYKENKAAVLRQKQQYYIKNRDKIREKQNKEYSERYHSKYFIKKKAQQVKRYAEYRKLTNEYKRMNPCIKCGEKNITKLHFHHIDPCTKLFAISNGSKYSKERIQCEIKKCIILCRKCHINFHKKNKEEL